MLNRFLCLGFMAFCLVIPGCDDAREEVEITWLELNSTGARRDGEAFARLLAPESFDQFSRLVKLALDAKYEQTYRLPLAERFEILRMRNRMTRKELSQMDGRAWIVHAVNQGWYGGREDNPLTIGDIRARGNSATADIILEWSGMTFVVTTMSFIKVEDRWLADWRNPFPAIEQIVKRMREIDHVSEDQALRHLEARYSGKEVPREVLEEPMR